MNDEQRARQWPARVNRKYFAPHMPNEPQTLVWRECERFPKGRFVRDDKP